MRSRFLPIYQSSRGAALVTVLIFIALLTIMVVSFLDTSRLDHGQAATHRERTRAGLFANEGVQRTLAILHKETADPPRVMASETSEDYAARTRNWISQPGGLIVPDVGADPKLLKRRVELSSGAPTSAAEADETSVLHPASLNIQLLNQQTPPGHLITDRPEDVSSPGGWPAMKLRWVYVRSDSENNSFTYDDSENPVFTDTAHPIVGRFAWWVDDESSKINYNLAWKRTPVDGVTNNSNPVSHPSTINLMALNVTGSDGSSIYLPESMANAIRTHTTSMPGRYFNSFADARLLENDQPGISEFLAENKFELTHYNHDPDTTFFGEERIMLTMNKDLAAKKDASGKVIGYYKFLDILRDDIPKSIKDPGMYDHIAGGQTDSVSSPQNGHPNKFDAVVRDLMRYLSTDQWPLSPGKSYKDKFFNSKDDHISQLAVNIIEYVRAKESKKKFIAPLRFKVNESGKYALGIGSAGYQGISRAPYLTEMGYWMERDPAPLPSRLPDGWPKTGGVPDKLYRCWFQHEFFLPKNYGFTAPVNVVPDMAEFPTTGGHRFQGLVSGDHLHGDRLLLFSLSLCKSNNGKVYFKSDGWHGCDANLCFRGAG